MKKLLTLLMLVASTANSGTVEYRGAGTGRATWSYGGTGTLALSSSGSESGAIFVEDTFTDTDSTELSTHTGETGATWVEHPSYATGDFIITTNRVRTSGSNGACYYASGVPASANYAVTALVYQSGSTISGLGPAGRISTSVNTMYFARYLGSSGEWQLLRIVAGTAATLGQFSATTANAATYTVKLSMVGSTIKVYLNGSEIISVTDTQITGAGRAGLRGTSSGTGGHHIASITATND